MDGRPRKRSIIENYFNIDDKFRLLGPLVEDANFHRDLHDLFNIVALIPLVALDVLNWSCPSGVMAVCGILGQSKIAALWHGQYWEVFWWTSLAYFVTDLAWVTLIPSCCKSPRVIQIHHALTIVYTMIPKIKPDYGWIMGACLIVEVNTWFLIARRFFNKRGAPKWGPGVPLLTTLRLTTISTWFYITWVSIRLFLYPMLIVEIWGAWIRYSAEIGTMLNLLTITPFFHTILIAMNLKWSVDLFWSKFKGTGKPSKGL